MKELLVFALLLTNNPAFCQEGQKSIAFVSDTQAPMWVESLFLQSNQNVKATGLIFQDIIKQKPGALFILGDVVSLGYHDRKWRNMDRYLEECRLSGITVSAVLGNHDVMTRPRKGEKNFQKRFSDHVRTGYIQTIDSIAIVLLNSNFKKMTTRDIRQEEEWLKASLKNLDENAAVKGVIVVCHHAPYSNSKLVGSSAAVQKYFVPAYLQSGKARLFITGHSHSFEHFRQEGKDFLVIGGGGGLHQPLNAGGDRLEDNDAGYKPMFHYLLVKRARQELVVASHFLKDDFSGFETGKTFSITLSK